MYAIRSYYAGAAPETLAQLEETLYAHFARLPEETANMLGAVLRARLEGVTPRDEGRQEDGGARTDR